MTESPPGFERFRERALRAYRDYGGEITRWGAATRHGLPSDLLELQRRYAAGRRLAKRAIEAALARLDAWGGSQS